MIDPSDRLHVSMERLRAKMSAEEFGKLVRSIPAANKPQPSPEALDPEQSFLDSNLRLFTESKDDSKPSK